jgi:hypothetical protein
MFLIDRYHIIKINKTQYNVAKDFNTRTFKIKVIYQPYISLPILPFPNQLVKSPQHNMHNRKMTPMNVSTITANS